MFEGKRILTGVQTTGSLHIGNYFGAIKPAIALANKASMHSMFLANYHAINAEKSAENLKQFAKNVACTYLAAGLNPSHSNFYKQSDVPELFEFATILAAFTPKGFMNKSHAYKAAVDKNLAANKPNDDCINMGLYTYPVLMASDILCMDTDIVPVGKDQIQHVEIARDIAGAINSLYDEEVLKLPGVAVEEAVAVIPGIDGRKMSKSYNNIIPLYADKDVVKKAIFAIKTDSRPMEEPKNPDEILIYQIYKSVADEQKIVEMAEGLRGGKLGYGHIKNMLLDAVLEKTAEGKEKFDYYMNNYAEVEKVLAEGAVKARKIAGPVLERLKKKVLG